LNGLRKAKYQLEKVKEEVENEYYNSIAHLKQVMLQIGKLTPFETSKQNSSETLFYIIPTANIT
jgi:hypothetical protein